MPIRVFALVFAIAFALTALLTPLAIRLGRRAGLVDRPGGRRTHRGAVVRIGGLALLPAFAAAALLPLLLGVPRDDPLELTRLTGVLLGMAAVWVFGLIDDKYRLSFWPQVLALLVASAIAIRFKVFIEVFNNPFTDTPIHVQWYVMIPLTVAWIAGMTGTVNMLDGLDGLATGVTALAACVLLVHMVRLGQYTVALLPLALIGTCLGFLPYNYSPARIFLGGGAYVLGYGLATLSIVAGAKVASALLVLWLPILDVAWQIYSRWRRRQPIGLGDRGHLHLRLRDLGWSQPRVVLTYCAVTALLGCVALFSPTRVFKLSVLLGLGVLILLVLALLAQATGDRTPTGS
ncbi:MAG: undecaprenyl/decaprenyl-phosphate alpha-N-acetylglucosaminyl 1-phosphate transferase [Anaerolineae bacterium]|nr:undecaprenyl/decaprenyl-phosphate alpha-N-acetylglucosaminyl 1-phosphate transferase [Anaerolineae bacterium]